MSEKRQQVSIVYGPLQFHASVESALDEISHVVDEFLRLNLGLDLQAEQRAKWDKEFAARLNQIEMPEEDDSEDGSDS